MPFYRTRLMRYFISPIMIVAFIISDLPPVQSQPAAGTSSSSMPFVDSIISDPSKLEVPFEYCTLKEIHKGTNGKLIIHIQDAHANLSGQKNLANTLDKLISKYDIPTVLVEGGDRDVTLDEVKSLAETNTWKIVANKFLYHSIITGPEYLNLVSEHDLKLKGIENQNLYESNLRTYASITKKRSEVLDYLREIQLSLNRLKYKLYPRQLLMHEEKMREGQKDPSSYTNFIDQLLQLAGHSKLAWMSEFSEVARLKRLRDKEKSIDFEMTNKEQTILLFSLRKQGLDDFVKRYVQRTKKNRNSQVSQLVLLNGLLELAKQNQVVDKRLPNLMRYKKYLEEFSQIKFDLLLMQLELLEEKIYGHLLKNNDLKKIRAIDQYVRLLRQGYQIRLSSRDFTKLRINKPDFRTEDWLNFINTKLKQINYHEDIIRYQSLLEDSSEELKQFYSLVNERDDAFLRNANEIMARENQKVAFMVTGGYHSENLTRLFRSQGYSYVVLTPVVTFATDHKKYERILLQPMKLLEKEDDVDDALSKSGLDSGGVAEMLNQASWATRLAKERDTSAARLSDGYVDRKSLNRALTKIRSRNTDVNEGIYLAPIDSIPSTGARLSSSVAASDADYDDVKRILELMHIVQHDEQREAGSAAFRSFPTAYSPTFSPDNRLISVNYDDKTHSVYDLKLGKDLKSLIGENVREVEPSKTGRYLRVYYRNHTAKLFDIKNNREVDIIPPNSQVTWDHYGGNIYISPDEKIVHIGYWDMKDKASKSKIIDISGSQRDMSDYQVLLDDENALRVKVSNDGKKIAFTFKGQPPAVYELDTGTQINMNIPLKSNAKEEKESHIGSVEFSPDSKYLVVKYSDYVAMAFDLTGNIDFENILKKELWSDYYKYPTELSFIQDGKILVAQYDHYDFDIIEMETGKRIEGLGSSEVSDDGKTLAGEYGKHAKVVDLSEGNFGNEYPVSSGPKVNQIRLSQDGSKVIVTYTDRYDQPDPKVFDVKTGDTISVPLENEANPFFSPDSKLVVDKRHDTSEVFALESGQVAHRLVGAVKLKHISFSNDGKKIAIIYQDKTFRIIDEEQISSNTLLSDVVDEWRESTYFGFDLLTFPVEQEFDEWFTFLEPWVQDFNDATTDYNRERLIELFKSGILKFLHDQNTDVERHLDFYLSIIEENKRLALLILEDMFAALQQGIISVELSDDEQTSIRDFIRLTNGFNLTLLKVLKEKGMDKLKEYLAFAEDVVLADEAGPDEIKSFKKKVSADGYDAEEVLFAVIQKIIPSSGASFVKKDEVRQYAQKFYNVDKDTRKDVPEKLRQLGEFGGGLIEKIEWVLNEGEEYDKEGHIKSLLTDLRYPDSGKEADQIKNDTDADRQRLVDSLKNLLDDFDNPKNREAALRAFLIFASHNDVLKEKVDRIQDESYLGLNLLDQLFRDKYNLSLLLGEVLNADFEPDGKSPILDVDAFKQSLSAIWTSGENKERKIRKRLRSVLSQEIKDKIISDKNLNEELRHFVRGIIDERLSRTAEEIRDALFDIPEAAIDDEKKRFHEVVSPDSINLGFRVVKGPGYGTWGLCAGVCIATDIKLWRDPNFFLVAMIDRNKKEAVGFIHLYVKTLSNGDKILTVPGIEPSAEFAGQVKSREVYPMIEEALQEIRRTEGYKTIVIPTDKNIHSNRTDYQDEIAKRANLKEDNPLKYKEIDLPEEVQWNNVPKPYPFTKVFEVPQGARMTYDHALYSTRMQYLSLLLMLGLRRYPTKNKLWAVENEVVASQEVREQLVGDIEFGLNEFERAAGITMTQVSNQLNRLWNDQRMWNMLKSHHHAVFVVDESTIEGVDNSEDILKALGEKLSSNKQLTVTVRTGTDATIDDVRKEFPNGHVIYLGHDSSLELLNVTAYEGNGIVSIAGDESFHAATITLFSLLSAAEPEHLGDLLKLITTDFYYSTLTRALIGDNIDLKALQQNINFNKTKASLLLIRRNSVRSLPLAQFREAILSLQVLWAA